LQRERATRRAREGHSQRTERKGSKIHNRIHGRRGGNAYLSVVEAVVELLGLEYIQAL
jgi:hypothetical protein